MRSPKPEGTGRHLGLEEYLADFDRYFWDCGPAGFWKLERQQHFQEPGVASWEAFRRGDWDESLALIERQRGHYETYFRRIAEHGFALHRVRCVEEPVSPYLQWELHLLRLKAVIGEDTRVLDGNATRSYEGGGELPEIIVLGSTVMYEIVYDRTGKLAGGVRFSDPREISRCRLAIQEMHRLGEPLREYFDRRIATLPPPRAADHPD
ncbi:MULTISPECIES: DUF6879 family protein [Kitasatospora]|uniref:DUF6879 domain-containing protein n=1 Tax=Kitasatospora setae (strain ATCC 33774 / DSM 43861 / JCM 3304 / KCC A-0304 / NBRC 14216 / KM-6054) TaxID=452652 RepID=E4N979_KITSK|nr:MULTISPECIES: DUF6879 family protein [Kitasatospora]BAJ27760.1 hypothetical protein KSE_19360 [Kitasatospora setae KM-6054]